MLQNTNTILLDANIVLRYLLGEEGSEIAQAAITSGAEILPEVIAEVIYVLVGVYKLPRKRAAEEISSFLNQINLANTSVYLNAIKIFGETKLDYVDCVLASYSIHKGRKILTFDKKLNSFISGYGSR